MDQGEGLHFVEFTPRALVKLQLTDSSLALVNNASFVENLMVGHSKDFFETADAVVVQASGGQLNLRFRADQLAEPGIYEDVITLSRERDGLVLLRTPVVVRISHTASERVLASLHQEQKPFDMIRVPFTLAKDSPVQWQGLYTEQDGGDKGYLGFYISNEQGHLVHSHWENQDAPIKAIQFQTSALPADNYELIVFRSFTSRGGAV